MTKSNFGNIDRVLTNKSQLNHAQRLTMKRNGTR